MFICFQQFVIRATLVRKSTPPLDDRKDYFYHKSYFF